MNTISGAVILGAGNVAWHMGQVLYKAGIKITHVYSRSIKSAQELAGEIEAQAVCTLDALPLIADLYLLALPDNVIPEVLANMGKVQGTVVHTSGTTPIELLSSVSEQFGVFYPLQTFSKLRPVNFETVPLCLEASSVGVMKQLKVLASLISGDVREIDTAQRQVLHVAAVFGCNFANYMLAVGEDILMQRGIQSDIFKPLIMETLNKALRYGAWKGQTGPAVRHDTLTMGRHEDMLCGIEDYSKLYRTISDSIIRRTEKEQKDGDDEL